VRFSVDADAKIFLSGVHAMAFAQVSYFGSITIPLLATAVDGRVTFRDLPTDP
jgi:hypothetical protein